MSVSSLLRPSSLSLPAFDCVYVCERARSYTSELASHVFLVSGKNRLVSVDVTGVYLLSKRCSVVLSNVLIHSLLEWVV